MTGLTPTTTSQTSISEFPKRGMPVTIITGFLGSGKTTLLNQILENKQDLKVAVLVNEFGDINIDAQLLVSTDDDMVELSNGCICCTINEGLIDAVYRVLERSDRIDYMIIETTGVADPLPIILTFLGTELRDLTHLDSVLGVVDAANFTPDHFDSEAALKQISYSDAIILNKTDLATPQKIRELEDYIAVVKRGARILKSEYGRVPLPLILDVGLTPVDRYHGEEERHPRRDKYYSLNRHSDHLQNDGFLSIAWESDRPFDIDKFEYFLTEKMPNEVFRAKGILHFSQSEIPYIFQLSGPRYAIQLGESLKTSKTQVVLIGRHLDQEYIRQQLNDCLA